jgi:hypothetical protein
MNVPAMTRIHGSLMFNSSLIQINMGKYFLCRGISKQIKDICLFAGVFSLKKARGLSRGLEELQFHECLSTGF